MHLLNPLSRFQLKPLPEAFPKSYSWKLLPIKLTQTLKWAAHPNPSPSIPIITAYTTGYGRNSRGIARRIAVSGYAIYSVDYLGFSLSEGLHGYIPNFDELVGDVIKQFTNVKGMKLLNLDSSDILHNIGFANFFELIATPGRSEVKGLPFFVMGESMGGAMSLKIHLKEPDKWDGVIVVAPTCKDTYRKTFVKSVFNCTGSGLCISST
ncbi:hypothetical protein DVH24_026058 [Malus domestica]|uniref:Serine aminopeptidase S33 domain-containing protein n=1 Tax=Malus domestica TaxID=3750 RepID=A0A498KMM1_MALDO|nr:hypothetical protein DVH24_026058 [Malus domestica]